MPPEWVIRCIGARYARQTFDRELYETLLHHTLEQPLGEGEFRLQNATAKIMARQLLKDVDAYF